MVNRAAGARRVTHTYASLEGWTPELKGAIGALVIVVEGERTAFTTQRGFERVKGLALATGDPELIRIVEAVVVEPDEQLVPFAEAKADLLARVEELKQAD